MSEGLTGGRAEERLSGSEAAVVSDRLFQADRVDGEKFEGVRYQHCTFANVSFKDATLARCSFENCAFIDCYFRGTAFDSTTVKGCKFISCTFPGASFTEVTFVYPEFRACFIPYKAVCGSLPIYPNLKRHMAEALAREAEAEGATGDAREYRLRAHEARETYLWRGFAGSDQWSREHFPSLPERFKAGASLAVRILNRTVWGYGDRGWVLARNALFLAVVVFPIIFYLLRDDLKQENGGSLNTVSYFLVSFDNMLNKTGFSGVVATTPLARAVTGAEVMVGLITIGLGIALLLKWITRR